MGQAYLLAAEIEPITPSNTKTRTCSLKVNPEEDDLSGLDFHSLLPPYNQSPQTDGGSATVVKHTAKVSSYV